jgi:hypothetical protein
MAKKRQCQCQTVCGNVNGGGKGEARWWFKMTESQVDHEYHALFAPIDGMIVFGAACCDACKAEIERRVANPGWNLLREDEQGG